MRSSRATILAALLFLGLALIFLTLAITQNVRDYYITAVAELIAGLCFLFVGLRARRQA